jgi:hypothetical protein
MVRRVGADYRTDRTVADIAMTRKQHAERGYGGAIAQPRRRT